MLFVVLHHLIQFRVVSVSCGPQTSSINEGGGRGAVIDVQWDPLSDQYCLVAYKSGHMTMFDMEREAAVQQFEPQPMGLTGVAWMRWSPGSFATVDSASGVMKVWNVSQRYALHHNRHIAIFQIGHTARAYSQRACRVIAHHPCLIVCCIISRLLSTTGFQLPQSGWPTLVSRRS